MAQIPIKGEVFFDILRTVLFDFQSPLSTPSGSCWRKKLTQNYGFWNSVSDWQKTPLHVLIFRCKLCDPRIRLRPIIFRNVIFCITKFHTEVRTRICRVHFQITVSRYPLPIHRYLWFLSRSLTQPKLSTIERIQITHSNVLYQYKTVML